MSRNFKENLVTVIVGLAIWIGIPVIFGEPCWSWSWLPAIVSMAMLDDEDVHYD